MRGTSRLPLSVLCPALLLACTPVSDPLAPAPRAAGPAAAPVCVVSMDDGEAVCPEAPPPVVENTEPCIERGDPSAFAHGPSARVHAFCTPKEAARKAVEALRTDE